MDNYCIRCGNKLDMETNTCHVCNATINEAKPYGINNLHYTTEHAGNQQTGNPQGGIYPVSRMSGAPVYPGNQNIGYTQPIDYMPPALMCENCGTASVRVDLISVQRPFGVANALVVGPLVALPVLGWIVLFAVILGNRTVTRRQMICQRCAWSKYIDPPPKPNPAGLIIWIYFGVMLIGWLIITALEAKGVLT